MLARARGWVFWKRLKKKAARRPLALLQQLLYVGGGFFATGESQVEINHLLSSLSTPSALDRIAVK